MSADVATTRVERGERGGEPPLLSICIPTYNRAAKLKRSLEELARMVAASAYRDRVEVVISDNASTDATPASVAGALDALAAACPVVAFRQGVNLGAEPNFKFLYENCSGRFMWLVSDDDVLVGDEVERMIADLIRHDPEVCISTYTTPTGGDHGVGLPPGVDVEMVDDVERAAIRLAAAAKITQYVLRVRGLTAEERAVSEEISRRIAWFSAFGMLLLVRYSPRLLLRRGVVARQGPDEGPMRYSPRVWGMVRGAVLMGLGDHPARARVELALPVTNTDVFVVGHLFRHVVGRGELDAEVAAADFAHVRANLWSMTRANWRNAVKIPVVLALFPLVHRWRGARQRKA